MVKMISLLLVGAMGLCIDHPNSKHPLYVSITDIEWNSKEQSLEIISKIFIDDLEAALTKNYNKKVDLFTAPNAATKQLVLDYLQKHLQIAVNGKSCTFSIVGYERQKEACWCYVEISNVSSVSKITVANTILHDYTTQQINLLSATVGSQNKSTKLVYPESAATFSF
jgi:hypothetical protein